MLRRHLLMASTAIALTAMMAGSAFAQATVVRIVAGDLVPDDPASENYIKNIEAGVKAMDGSEIDVQIVAIASSSYADKLSALLLGGDIPDIIYFQGGDQKMVEQGILADLNPLIANTKFLKNELYGHNVERMKNYPYLVYNFPPRAPQPVIRSDWLEKLGGKKPETVDEYTALFQAIHDGDLDGDGTAEMAMSLPGLNEVWILTLGNSTTRNGSGVNTQVLTQNAAPALGQVWNATLDCSGISTGQAFLFGRGLPSSGTFLGVGEVLIGGPHYFQLATNHVSGPTPFAVPFPVSSALIDLPIFVQGACAGAPGLRLSNALDLLIDR